MNWSAKRRCSQQTAHSLVRGTAGSLRQTLPETAALWRQTALGVPVELIPQSEWETEAAADVGCSLPHQTQLGQTQQAVELMIQTLVLLRL